jgi:SPP1 family predicted phage head-tail adaptor
VASGCCASLSASFKRRLTIQTLSKADDGQGGFVETWIDGDDVWGSIEPLSGFQKYQAMQMQTPLTHKIVLRYRKDITTAIRLKYDERIFWVREVLNQEEANRFLTLKVNERFTA